MKPYHRYARSRIFGNMENVLRKLDKQVLNISDKVLVKENNLNVNTKTNTLHLIPNTYNNTTNTYKKRTLAQLNSYI
ncbi:MAG: hypothetical protein LBQ24_03425 [Candidatus Peribacteria bacterium]|nr:hypothetical protein [Candidatus Peribacteria bacterium]